MDYNLILARDSIFFEIGFVIDGILRGIAGGKNSLIF
jgi:hypothetical protein